MRPSATFNNKQPKEHKSVWSWRNTQQQKQPKLPKEILLTRKHHKQPLKWTTTSIKLSHLRQLDNRPQAKLIDASAAAPCIMWGSESAESLWCNNIFSLHASAQCHPRLAHLSAARLSHSFRACPMNANMAFKKKCACQGTCIQGKRELVL